MFLGDQLTDIFEQIEEAGTAERSKQGGLLGLGVDALPRLPRHAGDRNRTSPFAFTGNKFEFRALGASQSISFPATVLNTIVAEAIDEMITELESRIEAGAEIRDALRALLSDDVSLHKRIIFNGDGYSDEWVDEAERRGLLNFRHTLEALPSLVSAQNAELFERYQVLSRRELASRHENEKGVIHAHSYKIANFIHRNLPEEVRWRVLTHEGSDGRDAALTRHLTDDEPTILLTPSMTEGIDLADDLARWQVLCKVPYPYLGDKQVAARMERDRDWYDWRTCLSVVQAYGRSVRSAEDHAVTYLLDAGFPEFIRRQQHRLPQWFLEAVTD